jgi:hypothetical protein
VHEREEKRNAACRPRLGACSAHAWFRLLSCTLPVAVRDGAADRPRLHRGRDTSSYATHYRFGGPAVLRLACRCSEQAAREERRRPPPPSPCSSRAPRNTARSRDHVKLLIVPLQSIDASEFELGFNLSGVSFSRRGFSWGFSSRFSGVNPKDCLRVPRATSTSLRNFVVLF